MLKNMLNQNILKTYSIYMVMLFLFVIYVDPPPRLHEQRAKGVLFCMCFVFTALLFYLSTFLLSYFPIFYFPTVLLVYFSTMFTASMFTVGMFTVGVGIVCVPHPIPPLFRRGSDVCPLLVSYFSINQWMYFWHFFLDVSYLLESMFTMFSIIVASLFRASFSHRF